MGCQLEALWNDTARNAIAPNSAISILPKVFCPPLRFVSPLTSWLRPTSSQYDYPGDYSTIILPGSL